VRKKEKVDKRIKWLEEHADEAVRGIDAAVADMLKLLQNKEEASGEYET